MRAVRPWATRVGPETTVREGSLRDTAYSTMSRGRRTPIAHGRGGSPISLEPFLRELTAKAECLGIDLLGVADLTVARSFIEDQGGPIPASFPRAVSLGMRLTGGVVDELFRHDDINVLNPYRGVYRSVNANLDRAAILLANELELAGFRAYPIPASERTDSARLCGAFSHKVAANLAGLGWVGKCCLLITPEYGPRLRFTTVLTDAPLPTRVPLSNHCGSCHACVDICPVQAFTGRRFVASEPREKRFNAYICDEYMRAREQHLGEGLCGLCMYVCPWGQRKPPIFPRRTISHAEVVEEDLEL
jgi:epoxyqueuosine reductase